MEEEIKSLSELLSIDYKIAKYYYNKANGDSELGII